MNAWYLAPLGPQTSRVRLPVFPARIEFEPLLELADLLGAPIVRRVHQAGRNVSFREVLQLHDLPPQRDIYRHDDLLDRAEPVCLVWAGIPRQVDELVRCEEPPRAPLNDLLVSRCRRLWPAAGIVEQYLDRRAVDDVEPYEFAATIAANFKRRGIEHEHIFQDLAKPCREGSFTVGRLPEPGQQVDPRRCVRGDAFSIARFYRPIELFDLVLARLDRQPGNIVAVGQRPQFVEPDGLVGARGVDRVVADRKIPQAHPLALCRRQWIAGRKDCMIGLKDLAKSSRIRPSIDAATRCGAGFGGPSGRLTEGLNPPATPSV